MHVKEINRCGPGLASSKVADFINTTSREWSIPKLKQVLSEEEALSISHIPISKIDTEDCMLWDFTTNELKFSPKLKHFWWKVCRNRLATKENLMRRNCANNPMCPMCGKHSESIEHLLFHCKWAKNVWFKSPISGGIFPNNINSPLSWSIAAKEKMDTGSWSSDFLAKAIFIAWYIWIARKEMVFQDKIGPPHGTMARALGAWGEFKAAKEAVQIHVPPSDRPPPAPKLWAAPPPGTLKINCDASWTEAAQKGWGGIILRNSRGCLLDVSIESDCASLISLSVSELVPPWEVSALITDIRKIGAELELSFCWTPREGNEAAHWIASSRASTLGCNWVSTPPVPLLSILCNDASIYQ
ncbi:uncharacterized protein LOC131303156 [Rhododendron vialii]|uniref:uncharacterized protein LOC131303156 n=1 Tax=Rhododendron vialii TaxID=182163 RepID=UPI00265FCFAF|nr:uncharacterized protein LOC131303156 [Rhododendron vialii]